MVVVLIKPPEVSGVADTGVSHLATKLKLGSNQHRKPVSQRWGSSQAKNSEEEQESVFGDHYALNTGKTRSYSLSSESDRSLSRERAPLHFIPVVTLSDSDHSQERSASPLRRKGNGCRNGKGQLPVSLVKPVVLSSSDDSRSRERQMNPQKKQRKVGKSSLATSLEKESINKMSVYGRGSGDRRQTPLNSNYQRAQFKYVAKNDGILTVCGVVGKTKTDSDSREEGAKHSSLQSGKRESLIKTCSDQVNKSNGTQDVYLKNSPLPVVHVGRICSMNACSEQGTNTSVVHVSAAHSPTGKAYKTDSSQHETSIVPGPTVTQQAKTPTILRADNKIQLESEQIHSNAAYTSLSKSLINPRVMTTMHSIHVNPAVTVVSTTSVEPVVTAFVSSSFSLTSVATKSQKSATAATPAETTVPSVAAQDAEEQHREVERDSSTKCLSPYKDALGMTPAERAKLRSRSLSDSSIDRLPSQPAGTLVNPVHATSGQGNSRESYLSFESSYERFIADKLHENKDITDTIRNNSGRKCNSHEKSNPVVPQLACKSGGSRSRKNSNPKKTQLSKTGSVHLEQTSKMSQCSAHENTRLQETELVADTDDKQTLQSKVYRKRKAESSLMIAEHSKEIHSYSGSGDLQSKNVNDWKLCTKPTVKLLRLQQEALVSTNCLSKHKSSVSKPSDVPKDSVTKTTVNTDSVSQSVAELQAIFTASNLYDRVKSRSRSTHSTETQKEEETSHMKAKKPKKHRIKKRLQQRKESIWNSQCFLKNLRKKYKQQHVKLISPRKRETVYKITGNKKIPPDKKVADKYADLKIQKVSTQIELDEEITKTSAELDLLESIESKIVGDERVLDATDRNDCEVLSPAGEILNQFVTDVEIGMSPRMSPDSCTPAVAESRSFAKLHCGNAVEGGSSTESTLCNASPYLHSTCSPDSAGYLAEQLPTGNSFASTRSVLQQKPSSWSRNTENNCLLAAESIPLEGMRQICSNSALIRCSSAVSLMQSGVTDSSVANVYQRGMCKSTAPTVPVTNPCVSTRSGQRLQPSVMVDTDAEQRTTDLYVEADSTCSPSSGPEVNRTPSVVQKMIQLPSIGSAPAVNYCSVRQGSIIGSVRSTRSPVATGQQTVLSLEGQQSAATSYTSPFSLPQLNSVIAPSSPIHNHSPNLQIPSHNYNIYAGGSTGQVNRYAAVLGSPDNHMANPSNVLRPNPYSDLYRSTPAPEQLGSTSILHPFTGSAFNNSAGFGQNNLTTNNNFVQDIEKIMAYLGDMSIPPDTANANNRNNSVPASAYAATSQRPPHQQWIDNQQQEYVESVSDSDHDSDEEVIINNTSLLHSSRLHSLPISNDESRMFNGMPADAESDKILSVSGFRQSSGIMPSSYSLGPATAITESERRYICHSEEAMPHQMRYFSVRENIEGPCYSASTSYYSGNKWYNPSLSGHVAIPCTLSSPLPGIYPPDHDVPDIMTPIKNAAASITRAFPVCSSPLNPSHNPLLGDVTLPYAARPTRSGQRMPFDISILSTDGRSTSEDFYTAPPRSAEHTSSYHFAESSDRENESIIGEASDLFDEIAATDFSTSYDPELAAESLDNLEKILDQLPSKDNN